MYFHKPWVLAKFQKDIQKSFNTENMQGVTPCVFSLAMKLTKFQLRAFSLQILSQAKNPLTFFVYLLNKTSHWKCVCFYLCETRAQLQSNIPDISTLHCRFSVLIFLGSSQSPTIPH